MPRAKPEYFTEAPVEEVRALPDEGYVIAFPQGEIIYRDPLASLPTAIRGRGLVKVEYTETHLNLYFPGVRGPVPLERDKVEIHHRVFGHATLEEVVPHEAPEDPSPKRDAEMRQKAKEVADALKDAPPVEKDKVKE